MGIAQGVRTPLGGPWFEDLTVGQVFAGAPPVTLTTAHAVLQQSVTGDRMRLPLDHGLSAAVCGLTTPVAHPLLVANLAIGQTTEVTQRVKANLFYRGMIFDRPVYLGDTIATRTEVVGLRQNPARPGRCATGLAALRCTSRNQDGDQVLDFYRCPMLPLRNPDGSTGHDDDFSGIPEELDAARLVAAVPPWDLEAFRARVPDLPPVDHLEVGTTFVWEGRDTVTGACELVRATLNMAEAHTDALRSPYGRRLVYGGHTISVAGAVVSRVLPGLVTIVAWRSCEHTGPVFEGDVLRAEITIESVTHLEDGALVDLQVGVWAQRADGEVPPGFEAGEVLILGWRLVGLVA